MVDSGLYIEALELRGLIHAVTGDTRLGLELLHQALALKKWLYPPTHPDLAVALNRISRVLSMNDRAKEALAPRAAAAVIERRSQTHCSGSNCARTLREDGAPLDVCVNCRCTFYCGKACQTADWKAVHKKECKELIEAASAAAAAAVGNSA